MRGYEESKIPRLFQLMEERNIKATELSNATGITKGSITDWKRGKSVPSGARLIALCNFFNVTAEYLLDTNEEIKAAEDNKGISLETLRALAIAEATPSYLSRKIIIEANKLDDSQKEHLLDYIEFLQSKSDKMSADEQPASAIREKFST